MDRRWRCFEWFKRGHSLLL